MKTKNVDEKIYEILFFLSLLLSGADILSISIAGNTIRIVQLLLFVIFIFQFYTGKIRLDYKLNAYFSPLLLAHLLTCFISESFMKTVLFNFWMIYNYLLVTLLFHNFVVEKRLDYLNIYTKIFKIIGILSIFHFIILNLGIELPFFTNKTYFGIGRAAVWFYEPSYLATYLSLFYSMSLYKYLKEGKKHLKDLILSILFLCVTTSTTGYVVLVLAPLVSIFFIKLEMKYLKKIFYLLIILMVSLLIIFLLNKEIIDLFIGRLFKAGLSVSSGVRIKTMQEGMKVFYEHKFLGIGAGAYEKYMSVASAPMNIFVEILSTLGIVGLLSFILFYCSLYLNYRENKANLEVSSLFFSFIIMLILLQMNQNYLRIYLWIHIGMFLGACNVKRREKNDRYNYSKL